MEVGSQLSGHIGFWRNSLHPVAVPSNLGARLSAETPNREANDVPHPLSGGLEGPEGRLDAKISLSGSCRDTTRFFRPRVGASSKVGIASAALSDAPRRLHVLGSEPKIEVETLSASYLVNNDEGSVRLANLIRIGSFCET